MHTEVVANIKAATKFFALLFVLLRFMGFINTPFRHAICSLFSSVFVLAFLSKENAAIFLAVFPLTFFTYRFQELKS